MSGVVVRTGAKAEAMGRSESASDWNFILVCERFTLKRTDVQ
jgi:hypothetical protein